MALDVLITFSGTTYALQCDTVEHLYSRLPTQAPFPGNEATDPFVFTLDLGMKTEQISLTGVVNTVSVTSGDPSIVNLETIASSWWTYGDNSSNMPLLQVASSPSHVALKQATYIKEAGTEDRWRYTLIWLVRDHNPT